MNQLSFRAATLEDLPVLLEFEQGIVQAERPFNSKLAPDPISYYDISKLIKADNAEVIIALDAKKIIASSYVLIKEAKAYVTYDSYAFLGFMYVLPEYRGKGVNGLIISQTEIWAKKRGVSEVQLDVYHQNESAIRAYQKVGFKKHLTIMRKSI